MDKACRNRRIPSVGCKLCWARFCDVEIATHFTMTCYFIPRATSGEIRFARNQITNLTSALTILVKKTIETTFSQTFFKHFSDVHKTPLRHEAPNGLRYPQGRITRLFFTRLCPPLSGARLVRRFTNLRRRSISRPAQEGHNMRLPSNVMRTD